MCRDGAKKEYRMGKKRWNNRKIGRRFWGFAGALWLVIACLAGCTVSGETVGDGKAVRISGEVEESSSQESEGGVEDGQGEDGNSGPGENRAEGPDSDAGPDIESGIVLEDSQSTDSSVRDGKTAGEIEESGTYTSKDEVALYLHVYGCLPDNYITKREAEDLGWNSKEGNLWDVAPGMSIGGSRFGNYEGALPDKEGRKYFECDIDYEGGYRGAKRLVYSDDGLIFYTEDHYNTFEQLYGQ